MGSGVMAPQGRCVGDCKRVWENVGDLAKHEVEMLHRYGAWEADRWRGVRSEWLELLLNGKEKVDEGNSSEKKVHSGGCKN